MKSYMIGILAATMAIAAAPANGQAAPTPEPASQAVKSGRVEVNGVNYYYEIHGNGEPLLLLHGGLGSMDMFARSCQNWPIIGR